MSKSPQPQPVSTRPRPRGRAGTSKRRRGSYVYHEAAGKWIVKRQAGKG